MEAMYKKALFCMPNINRGFLLQPLISMNVYFPNNIYTGMLIIHVGLRLHFQKQMLFDDHTGIVHVK